MHQRWSQSLHLLVIRAVSLTAASRTAESQSRAHLQYEILHQDIRERFSHVRPSSPAETLTRNAYLQSTPLFSQARAAQDAIPAVRSAACRAAGVAITFPFVPDRHLLTSAILRGVGDPVISVRILATWALANLCEALGEQTEDAAPTQRGTWRFSERSHDMIGELR